MRRFTVTGMTCSACSASVERAVRKLDFVEDAQVNLLTGELKVVGVEPGEHTDEIVRAIQGAGYGVAEEPAPQERKASTAPADRTEADALWRRFVASLCFLVPLMVLSMQHMLGYPLPAALDVHQSPLMHTFWQLCLTTPVLVLSRSFFISGYGKLLHGAPNMDTLVAIGSTAAFGYSFVVWLQMLAQAGDANQLMPMAMDLYFEAAAMILTLITLGKALEARAKQKTTFAIEKLMRLSPQDAALLLEDGSAQRVPVARVKPGDKLLVMAGERIAVDGELLSAHASVDEAHITGESLPVDKQKGDALAAGSMNLQGAVQMLVQKTGEDTTLAKIIRLVEEAGGSKAPIAKLADRVSGIFVPVVLGIAAVTFVVWMLAGESFGFALARAIAVLVISCPCALGLATPVAIMVGTGVGAQHGVLFRNGTVLETMHHVRAVVLDKTGTLTLGRMRLSSLRGTDGSLTDDELLRLAAAVESGSEHPIGRAICQAAADKGLALSAAANHETLPGLGIRADVSGDSYLAGNQRLMEQSGVALQAGKAAADEALAQGCSLLYLARGQRLLGVLGVSDTLKEDAPWTVEQLKRLHVKPYLLTGDHRRAAEAIAKQAGIDEVLSEVMPQEKSQLVANLQHAGALVAMVGDGVNDAPALRQADVGIAMGSGTDVAIETSDVVLAGNRLAALPTAIRLSRATLRNIRQNLFWAFFYNVLGIPVAAGALYPAFGITLNPMLGAAAMSLSSVFVVTNALRLKRFRASEPERALHTKNKEDKTMQQKTIFVEGMSCNHCKAAVEKALMKLPQVEYAEVNLDAKTAHVTLDSPAEDDTLRAAVTEAGYTVTKIQ